MKTNYEEFEKLCERFQKNKESLGFSAIAALNEDGKISLSARKVPKQYNQATSNFLLELYSQFFPYVARWLNDNFLVAEADEEEKKEALSNLLTESRIVLLNTLFQKDLPALQQKLKECCGKLQLQYELNHLQLDAEGNWVTWEGKKLSVPTDSTISGEDSISIGLSERS